MSFSPCYLPQQSLCGVSTNIFSWCFYRTQQHNPAPASSKLKTRKGFRCIPSVDYVLLWQKLTARPIMVHRKNKMNEVKSIIRSISNWSLLLSWILFACLPSVLKESRTCRSTVNPMRWSSQQWCHWKTLLDTVGEIITLIRSGQFVGWP